MTTTTRIIDWAGGIAMIVGHAYMVGGWQRWWQTMNGPVAGMTEMLITGPQPQWARALFWLGVGLFALGLWRQWSGV